MSKYEEMIRKRAKECPNCHSSNVGTVFDCDSFKEGWYCPDCNLEFDMEYVKVCKNCLSWKLIGEREGKCILTSEYHLRGHSCKKFELFPNENPLSPKGE